MISLFEKIFPDKIGSESYQLILNFCLILIADHYFTHHRYCILNFLSNGFRIQIIFGGNLGLLAIFDFRLLKLLILCYIWKFFERLWILVVGKLIINLLPLIDMINSTDRVNIRLLIETAKFETTAFIVTANKLTILELKISFSYWLTFFKFPYFFSWMLPLEMFLPIVCCYLLSTDPALFLGTLWFRYNRLVILWHRD